MNFVRSILPSAYAAKARGLVLCAIAVSAVYVYYLAVDADDAIPPAAADFIPAPPVVRATPITSPVYIIPDAAAHEKPIPTARKTRDGIAHELQTALTKARCYDGPVTGRWTAASQVAMSAFLAAVNAHMPIDDPNETLLALVASNPDAGCTPKPALVGDTGGTPMPAIMDRPSQTKVAAAADVSVASPPETRQDAPGKRSMLDHPWAQPEMLVPSVEMMPSGSRSAADDASASHTANAAEDTAPLPPHTASAHPAATSPAPATIKVSTAASDDPKLHFEGGSIIADEKPDMAPAPPAPVSARAKTSPRKTRAAKRRAPRPDNAPFGVSFDSIQKSLSSLFDY